MSAMYGRRRDLPKRARKDLPKMARKVWGKLTNVELDNKRISLNLEETYKKDSRHTKIISIEKGAYFGFPCSLM
jgi:hypothetical protein